MIFFQIRIPLYLFPHRFAIRLALSSLALSGLALSNFENLTKLISKLTASYRKNKRIKKANRKLNSFPTPLKQIFT